MKKIKLGIIYGGMSTEHDVSTQSAKSVMENLNKEKYEIYPIYIEKNGTWLDGENKKIENAIEELKKLDVIFPVLHGLYGEDGTIQGLLELIKIPYVGSNVVASANCMDKVYSKIIFEKAKIPQARFVYVKKMGNFYSYFTNEFNQMTANLNEIAEICKKEIGLPAFVKPSNSGSSVGINKAHNIKELMEAIEYAAKFDKKILIEEAINGREIECAVLGNKEPKASCVGEILPADEFYSYEAKYENTATSLEIPAKISEEKQAEIKKTAIKAYRALDCKGLARIDFFLDEKTNRVYINEINTLPGFTKISMYPKLWEFSGIKYSDLLDILINLALEKE